MHWINNFQSLQLDIVGIIAVLGEGSVTRNAQVTSLSWWSILPRFLPAPQALLEHERKYRLPTAPGIVAGAYSGTIKKEINFFAQLLHQRPLDDFEVELVEVVRNKDAKGPSFGPRPFGPLLWVTLLGSAMGLALIILAAYYDDGFALFSTVMLSMVSCTVGIGTRWNLAFREPKIQAERRGALPRSDVVIYYPNGAMRVVRVEHEEIARLYFQTEHAQYKIEDTPYRTLAVLSTIMLMAGVVSLANASNILQVAFAAAYIVLNGIYWTVSALNPFRFHWRHFYKTHVLNIAPLPTGGQDHPVKKKSHVKRTIKTFRHEWHRFQISWGLIDPAKRAPTMTDPSPTGARNFTAALWTAIVLTGTSQWLNEATTIAPVYDAWKQWLLEAGEKVQPIDEHEGRFEMHRTSGIFHSIQRMPTGTDWRFIRAADTPEANHTRRIIIRQQIGSWEYNKRLTAILAEYAPKTGKPYPDETDETVAPVTANNESAQGTSSAVEAPPRVINLARRLTGLISSSTSADPNTQTVLSTSTDVEKAHG